MRVTKVHKERLKMFVYFHIYLSTESCPRPWPSGRILALYTYVQYVLMM